jgi:zinc finger protein
MSEDMPQMDILEGETCPICSQKTLTLTDAERDIPFFGAVAIFSMSCSSCGYHKAEREPSKYTLEVNSEEDMNIRVIKSSFATLKIAHVGSIESGESASGYVTNVEGILNRIKKQVEFLRDSSDEKSDVKKAKNMLKKITKIMWGQEKAKITLEDPTGNSAIISEKATITKMKKSKK